jgi:hypothetical protein
MNASLLLSALAAARTAFDAGAERALTDAEWQRVLETRRAARLGAQPLPGRRALVLLEGGLGSRSFTLACAATSATWRRSRRRCAGRSESPSALLALRPANAIR